ncbi:MAG TPA: SAM-dependent methyltransferase [Kineosporiaceae bacterium]|nr:SAM-dependent methyltransferase [Kineosporiaceae bacterium]
MPEPLEPALARLRPLLADPRVLVRAVAAGRRRRAQPAVVRAELRPVALKAGVRLQVTTTDGRTPTTRNHAPGPDADGAVAALLAEPFGNWHVETHDEVVQLRVTKSGEAQLHRTARTAPAPAPAGHDRDARHLLDPGDPLFAALGADADKRRQVDAFLRQLVTALPPALEQAAAQSRPLRVVDLGCGNAYLTFAAHRHLGTLAPLGVRTLGVDVRPDLVERNTRLAAQVGLDGLGFAVGTIEDADPGDGPVDVVLALHACDTATDDALARAVAWRAPVVLAAPCCHHDVQRQLEAARAAGEQPPEPHAALVRHPILRERFADVLTDTFRAQLLRLAGYGVDVVEFVDSRHTPRNALIRASLRRPARRGDDAGRQRLAHEHAELAAAWHVRPALADRLARAGAAPAPA